LVRECTRRFAKAYELIAEACRLRTARWRVSARAAACQFLSDFFFATHEPALCFATASACGNRPRASASAFLIASLVEGQRDRYGRDFLALTSRPRLRKARRGNSRCSDTVLDFSSQFSALLPVMIRT